MVHESSEVNMNTKRYALLVLIAGIATFASMIFMIAMSGGEIARPSEYPNKDGFTQGIFWFEMARSPEEVMSVLGDPASPEGIRLRTAMDLTNTYDYIFMVCYPLLIAALFLFVNRLITDGQRPLPLGRVLVAAGLCLSAVTLFADAYENIQLLKLTTYADIAGMDTGIITRLIIGTNIKSGAITAAGFILVYFYAVYFRWSWGLLLPLLYLVSAILAFIALTSGSYRALIEPGATIGMIGWLISTVHGGYHYVKNRR